jgi:hypothetical protein
MRKRKPRQPLAAGIFAHTALCVNGYRLLQQYDKLWFRLFLHLNRFYRAYFVAAKTPYATVVIN